MNGRFLKRSVSKLSEAHDICPGLPYRRDERYDFVDCGKRKLIAECSMPRHDVSLADDAMISV